MKKCYSADWITTEGAMTHSYVEFVEEAAQMRNEPEVPRTYIEEALRLVVEGREEVSWYPSGMPSVKGIYDVAARLESATTTKN